MAGTISGEKSGRTPVTRRTCTSKSTTSCSRRFAAGSRIDNSLYMCRSTMLAILGRMAAYTGQRITWEQAMNSQEDLTPAKYEWGPIPMPPSPCRDDEIRVKEGEDPSPQR